MARLFTDLAISTLASNISSGATSLTVQTGDGSKYPAPTGGDTFDLFLYKKATGEYEIVSCTARSGDVLTITATSRAYAAGDLAELRPTAAFFTSLSVTSTNVQAGAFNWDASDTGAADAYVIQLSPTLVAYPEGAKFRFLPAFTNTGGACTLQIDALSAISVKDLFGNNPAAGTIRAGIPVEMTYSSGTFYVSNPAIQLTEICYRNVTNAYSKQQYFPEQALTDAANIAWNLDDNQAARVTLAGNRTLSAPTNMQAGGTYTLRVIQDATGGRTLAFNSVFKWDGGVAPVMSTGANAVDLLTFYCDGTNMLGGYLLNVS